MSDPVDFAFVHGGGQGAWAWDETIAALRAQTAGLSARMLALDVPGCGAKRGRATDGLALEDVARELLADIENAGLKRAVLVGHSQGGQVMSLMAEMRPQLFQRLVYVSCSIPLPGQDVLAMMGKGVHGSNENEVGWPFDPKLEAMSERYSLMFCNDMDEAQAAAFFSKLGQDRWPLATYSFNEWKYEHHGAVPATYVLCLRDNILPLAWQEAFAERFWAERRVRIDAGHQVMNTRPQALAEALRQELGLSR